MRFLCDEMLKGLARWLRTAGYDVVVEPDCTDDGLLLEKARNEDRILLTRDRRLAEARPRGASVMLLECNDLDACFDELKDKLDVDWLHRPFSRCLACNTPLSGVGDDRWHEIPAHSRERATRLLYCPSCNQLFWDGSHVKRMHERLTAAANRHEE